MPSHDISLVSSTSPFGWQLVKRVVKNKHLVPTLPDGYCTRGASYEEKDMWEFTHLIMISKGSR
jgi:hypothetical protein